MKGGAGKPRGLAGMGLDLMQTVQGGIKPKSGNNIPMEDNYVNSYSESIKSATNKGLSSGCSHDSDNSSNSGLQQGVMADTGSEGLRAVTNTGNMGNIPRIGDSSMGTRTGGK